MSDRSSLARELVDLVDALPGRFAAVEVRAAWTRRTAAVMRLIAAETDNPLIAREAAAHAVAADRRAADLETGTGGGL